MKMKKRVYLALMMPFLCFVGGAAQEVTEGVPVDENPNLVLWEDSLVDNCIEPDQILGQLVHYGKRGNVL